MNYLPYIIIALGGVSLILFLKERDRNGSIKALAFKTLTSFFFIMLAFTSYVLNELGGIFFPLIMMGLVLGLIGDIVLDLKIIYKESSSAYQFMGMTSFLCGHLFYLAALFIYFGFSFIPLIIALALAVIIILMSKYVFKFKFKEHTVHTYLYSFILSYMMTQACYAAISSGYSTATVLLAIGAILFLLSDLVLVMTYYDNKDSKPFIAVNHILYYGAQFLIALSVLFFIA